MRVLIGSMTLLFTATCLGFGGPPTAQDALDYAKSVVFVKRVLKDNQIHAYVKEVWRFDPADGTPPSIGAEYGKPTSYDSRMVHPDRDAVIFDFGPHRADGLPASWRIPVKEDGTVPTFGMSVRRLRGVVQKTKPIP